MKMYQIGEYVVYGNIGVCQIESIGPIQLSESNQKKEYYTLIPVYTNGSKVFTPVGSEKVKMRPVIKKEDAITLIDQMDQIDAFELEDDKMKEQVYKEMLKSYDYMDYIRMIKTLYARNQSRIADGKKENSSDLKYFDLAESYLYEEFAIALQITKEEVKEYIAQRVNI